MSAPRRWPHSSCDVIADGPLDICQCLKQGHSLVGMLVKQAISWYSIFTSRLRVGFPAYLHIPGVLKLWANQISLRHRELSQARLGPPIVYWIPWCSQFVVSVLDIIMAACHTVGFRIYSWKIHAHKNDGFLQVGFYNVLPDMESIIAWVWVKTKHNWEPQTRSSISIKSMIYNDLHLRVHIQHQFLQ